MHIFNALTLVSICFFQSGETITPGGGPFDDSEEIIIPGNSNYFKSYISFCQLAKEEQRRCQVALKQVKSHHFPTSVPTDVTNRTWTLQYNLVGNLHENVEVDSSERRVASFQHLSNTVYIKGFDMVSEESEEILIHHFALIFCRDLGEGVTVNQDILFKADGNERQACHRLIAPYGDAWANPVHVNTSENQRAFWLPENVGMMVGTKSNYKFAGVSVHYTYNGKVPVANPIQKSRILVTVTNQPPKYYMGMIYSNTYFEIPSNKLAISIPGGHKDYTIGTSCIPTISEDLHIFAYALHTHARGTGVGIWIHSPDANVTRRIVLDETPFDENKLEWLPNEIVVKPGDIVLSTCTFDTSNTGDISLGGTSKTEMCDFLLSFYRTSDDKDDQVIKCADNVVTNPAQWKQIQQTV